jgi:hypothetical protein
MAEDYSNESVAPPVAAAMNGTHAKHSAQDIRLLQGNGDTAGGGATQNGQKPALFWSAPLSAQEELNWYVSRKRCCNSLVSCSIGNRNAPGC